MFSFKSVYFVLFNLVLWPSQAEISDKRMCIDKQCSELISVGKTLLRYASPEDGVLSFGPNEDVKIFSYGAGKRPELIGVELKGKRGYINKNHVRELNLLKRPELLVDTEVAQEKTNVPLESAASEIQADATQELFEIVDGTKIPLDLASLSTEIPVANSVYEGHNSENDIYSTPPLNSVPENPNVNQATKPPLGVVPGTETGGNQKEVLPDDEDDDDDNDIDTDEGDEEKDVEDGEEDQEKADVNNLVNEPEVIQDSVSDSSKNLLMQNDVEETSPNTPDNNVINSNPEGIKEEIVEKEPKNKNDVVVNGSDVQGKLENATGTDPIEPVVPNVAENITISETRITTKDVSQESGVKPSVSENDIGSEIDFTDNIQQKLNTETDESNIVSNEQSATPADSSFVTSTIVPSQGQAANIFVGAEATSELKEEKKGEVTKSYLGQVLGQNKESLPIQVGSGLPSTTEIPIEIEALPPIDLESVTPNPQGANSEQQSFSDDTVPQKYDLPNNMTPLVNTEVNGEGPASIGIVTGILSVLDSGDNKSTSAGETKPPIEEPVFKNSLGSDEPIDTIIVEDKTLKDAPTPDENNMEKSDAGFTDEIENSSHSEQSGSIISEIKSFLGFGGETENDNTVEENQDLASEVLVDNGLDKSRAVEVNANANENHISHNPWSSDYEMAQVNAENLGVCDSESEKCPQIAKQGFCDKENEDCPKGNIPLPTSIFSRSFNSEDLQELFIESFSSDMFLYLVTTSLSVLVLIFVWVLLDKCRREGPLIARINKLEQQLLATSKENEMLQEKATLFVEEKTQLVVETVPNEVVDELNVKLSEMYEVKLALEDQIQALEKELDTSTEVGIELNKIISEMLSSTDASEILRENVEQMKKKLLEQQDTINCLSETLNLRETENRELRLELEVSNNKVTNLQSEVDKMVEKILKIEEEKGQQHKILESEIAVYQNKCKEALSQEHVLKNEISVLNKKVGDLQRVADTKIKEYGTLKETIKTLKSVNNDKNALKSFLDVSEIKAHLEQMKSENLKYSKQLSQERETNISYTTQVQSLSQEMNELRERYAKADKEKVEISTKLEVLNTYFKEKEDQMQREISKYESLWAVKEGEATSTSERIRYMQEELQNYKAQNESLKQEIVNQEVELKSQISLLEKKAHENWVTNRQTERKLEETRQEAALLRNRLTMRERAIAEGHNQIRMQSPLRQNGELPISPPPIDPTQSPPPLFNHRDHITKSPPIPGLPPPFLPPPLGGTPFIPPPPLDGMMHPPLGDMGGMPPFIPGLHTGMFPGDHRPPPLGRMSSPPPVGGRYTPESAVYSEYDRYDRGSPSPPYDSEYGASPPPIRGYSPYDDRDRLRDDRREYKRPQPRSNGRHSKGVHSSGSENDSLGKINKKPQRKV